MPLFSHSGMTKITKVSKSKGGLNLLHRQNLSVYKNGSCSGQFSSFLLFVILKVLVIRFGQSEDHLMVQNKFT